MQLIQDQLNKQAADNAQLVLQNQQVQAQNVQQSGHINQLTAQMQHFQALSVQQSDHINQLTTENNQLIVQNENFPEGEIDHSVSRGIV